MTQSFTARAIKALENMDLVAEAFGDNEVYGHNRADEVELVVRQEDGGYSVFIPGVRVRRYNETRHETWRAAMKDVRFRIGTAFGEEAFGDLD